MSDTPTDAVDDLKRRARRRLIGAITLAVVAAIVFPAVLERQPKPLGPDVQVEIPPINSDRFVTRLYPQQDAAATAPAAAGNATPAAPAPDQPKLDSPIAKGVAAADAQPTTPPEQSKDGSEKAVDQTSAGPAPQAAKPGEEAVKHPEIQAAGETHKPAAAEKTFVVQLAAYAEPASAEAQARKLQAGGFPAFTQALSTSHGALTRVRVGPFPSKDAAEAARAKLKAEGQNGLVEPSR